MYDLVEHYPLRTLPVIVEASEQEQPSCPVERLMIRSYMSKQLFWTNRWVCANDGRMSCSWT